MTDELPGNAVPNKGQYDREERQLTAQSEAFLHILTSRGLVEDEQINNERLRQAEKDKKRRMYHNTTVLLSHYRDIIWAFECLPGDIAAELDRPLNKLDALLGAIAAVIGMDNKKLDARLDSINKSRLLLQKLNEAVSILRKKPGKGQLMYEIIYETYLSETKYSHADLIYRLNLSDRQYYRLRTEAINIIAIRLWSAPEASIDSWLEVLTLFETI